MCGHQFDHPTNVIIITIFAFGNDLTSLDSSDDHRPALTVARLPYFLGFLEGRQSETTGYLNVRFVKYNRLTLL